VALVIEVLGRGGRARQYFKVGSDEVTLGRGYQNDVVLDDPYISIDHLRLEKTDQGWKIIDLDSLNGVQVVKSPSANRTFLVSGSEIKLGRTRLRIVSDQTGMQAAKPLHRFERDSSKLNHWSIFLPLFLVFVGLGLFSSYMNSFSRWEWKDSFFTLLSMQLGTLFVAGFWALIGRFARHESYFLGQYSLVLVACLTVLFGEAILSVLNYNTSFVLFGDGASKVFVLAVILVLISANLALATHMTVRSRWLTSCLFTGFFVLITEIGDIERWGEFSPRPEYFGGMVTPVFLFVDGQSNQVFLEQAESLFKQVKRTATETTNN
jgi:hypothetical protein